MSLSINQLAYELLINAVKHGLVLDCDDDLFDSLCDDDEVQVHLHRGVKQAMAKLFKKHPRQTTRSLKFLAAGELPALHAYLMPLVQVYL